MAMKWICLLLVCLAFCEACEYSRPMGMLKNSFQNDGNDESFNGDPGADTLANIGGTADVVLTNPVNILENSDAGFTHLRIFDVGCVEFGTAALTTTMIDFNTGVQENLRTSRKYACAKWYDTVTPTVESYKFSYRHIKRNEQISNNEPVKPFVCDLEMVEAHIDRCEKQARTTSKISEMVVITWEVKDAAVTQVTTLFQMVIAVLNQANTAASRETYILMIYNDNAHTALNYFAGYINGDLTGSTLKYNTICNYDGTSSTPHGPLSVTSAAEMTTIHSRTNCRCAKNGVYIFRTKENTVADTYQKTVCSDAVATTCALRPVDDGKTYQRNCRPPVIAEDTCTESYYCQTTRATTGSFTLNLFALNPKYTTAFFIPYDQADVNFAPGDKFAAASPCGSVETITANKISYTTDFANTAKCVQIVGRSVNFAIVVSTQADFNNNVWRDGMEVIKGQCDLDDLPYSKSVTQNIGDIATTIVPDRTSRRLTLEVIDQKEYMTSPATKVLSGSNNAVELGRYIFLSFCYDAGTPIIANADPYGIYVTDCKVSNNPTFSHVPATQLYALQIIENNGCRPTTLVPTSPFYMTSTFKKVTMVKTDYNFCQTTGGIRAARWISAVTPGNIYFRCKAQFCTNQQASVMSVSKCADSCAYTVIDDGTRKRRDVMNVTDSVTEVTLDAVIRVVGRASEEAQTSCVERTTAMPTIIALIGLLVLAAAVAVMLFIKLQMKKKQ